MSKILSDIMCEENSYVLSRKDANAGVVVLPGLSLAAEMQSSAEVEFVVNEGKIFKLIAKVSGMKMHSMESFSKTELRQLQQMGDTVGDLRIVGVSDSDDAIHVQSLLFNYMVYI